LRDAARADSDTDVMIDLDPPIRITVPGYAGLKDFIGAMVGGSVDVINRDTLKAHIRPAALADAIYAF
jgi:uncharacterized protein